MDNSLSGLNDPAFGETSSEFDQVLPAQIITLDIISKRLEMNGRVMELDNPHKDAQRIYKTIVTALQSDWFSSLSENSQIIYSSQLFHFLSWFRKKIIISENRFKLLKNYEAYRVNDCSLKPQSTGLKQLICLLSEGMRDDVIDRDTFAYIDLLLDSTSPSYIEEREPSTLTNYFASMPWLRDVLGENDYLRLESPKRLMSSFSITVATTLLVIIKSKIKAITQVHDLNQIGASGKNLRHKEEQMSHWNRDLIIQLGQLAAHNQHSDILTELLLLDCVVAKRHKMFVQRCKESTKPPYVPLSMRLEGKRCRIYKHPFIFSPEWFGRPSPIEERLFAWLCAWQTVQPMDIKKLKREDFIISKNHIGRPVLIQCQYYKGRSGREHEPPLLDANSIEGKAIIAYLQLLPPDESHLLSRGFKHQVHATFTFNTPIATQLARLWQSEIICQNINKHLKLRQSNRLFLRAFTAMSKFSGEGYDKWEHRQKDKKKDCSVKAYRSAVQNYLPSTLFSFMAIKTSAIHARTDLYRDRDLVNQNSHTAETEKTSYLTDANKEWINQNGRLTRLVLHDIEHYVYRPNLDAAVQTAHELLFRTQVVNGVDSGTDDHSRIRINPLGKVIQGQIQLEDDIEPDDILVLDTPETVVYMQHYIAEAESKYESLIQHALSFFERTVLPNVEWMHGVLQQHLNPSVVRQGIKDYEEIKTVLPPLFSSELRGGVSS